MKRLQKIKQAAVVLGMTVTAAAAIGAVAISQARAMVGEVIPVSIVCTSEGAVTAHAQAMVEDKSYDRANQLLRLDIAGGRCAVVPRTPVEIAEARVPAVFVDSDGDNMEVTVVVILSPGGERFYTLHLRVLRGA